VVPYLGDLFGIRGLYQIGEDAGVSARGRVANTFGYRRRKGTATVLEQLARDTTGWDARAVEFFELLGTTQYLNHLRPHSLRTPDLRRTADLEMVETAFDRAAHTLDVRHIASGRGRHNIPNVGLFLWRLQSYAVAGTTARAAGDGRFRFDPTGRDLPLYNRPQTEDEITHLAEERNLPGPLRRRPLYDELESRRQALVDGRESEPVFFGRQPVLEIAVRMQAADPFVAVPPEEILICNLSDPPVPPPEVWLRPPTTRSYLPSAGGPAQARPIRVAVDPVLGRLAFPVGVVPNEVMVDYGYGAAGDVGAGPYSRQAAIAAAFDREMTWQVGVSRALPPGTPGVFPSLAAAVAEWNAQPPGAFGVISILDSRTYTESLTAGNRIQVPEGSRLFLLAANRGLRPHLVGDVSVIGTASAGSQTPGELIVDGLLIEGKLTVLSGNLGLLRFAHGTLVPSFASLAVNAKNERLTIALARSICGAVEIPVPIAGLRVEESVLQAPPGFRAINALTTPVEIEKSTLLGGVRAQRLEAGNSLFTAQVTTERLQVGCVRFSYLPPGSTTPRRFRCQPDRALEGVALPDQPAVRARLVPAFTSLTYGDPGYVQLAAAAELHTGAEDGSEMGVWSYLKQPQRDSNLRTSLEEYLRLGLEAGLVYVT
jgi:hypothetical protein